MVYPQEPKPVEGESALSSGYAVQCIVQGKEGMIHVLADLAPSSQILGYNIRVVHEQEECMGRFQWVTSPMGLMGGLARFQHLMETVVNCISKVIIYIDNLLVHSTTHEEHLVYLHRVLQSLVQHNIKMKLQ
jgi:hypothetical protein